MQIKGSLQKLFLAVCVFLINFNFSFPRIPKIAALIYFWVFVVKVKIEISLKILDRFWFLVWFYFNRRQGKI